MNEQARLDDAMRRADELLVASLKLDERRRYRRRIILFSASRDVRPGGYERIVNRGTPAI